ncbi:MAG: hypothetical protein Q4F97_00715 [Bacteroidales bacterium]|nr:hypothetical protein [Bacteroidales bacterium]
MDVISGSGFASQIIFKGRNIIDFSLGNIVFVAFSNLKEKV